jgi:hypothetical protein
VQQQCDNSVATVLQQCNSSVYRRTKWLSTLSVPRQNQQSFLGVGMVMVRVMVLLSHCCYTVVTLFPHYSRTMVTLSSHYRHTVVTLWCTSSPPAGVPVSALSWCVVTLLLHGCYTVFNLLLDYDQSSTQHHTAPHSITVVYRFATSGCACRGSRFMSPRSTWD